MRYLDLRIDAAHSAPLREGLAGVLRESRTRGRHRAEPVWRLVDLLMIGLSVLFVALGVGLAMGTNGGDSPTDTSPEPVAPTTSAPASIVVDR